jgi:hypothetical protein
VGDLYKYLKRSYADDLITRGTVRIGTLYEYRKIDLKNTARTDFMEGSQIFRVEGSISTSRPSAGLDYIRRFTNFQGSELSGDNAFVHEIGSPDCYLYCTTSSFDERAMSEFGDDACVRIIDPHAFFEIITAELARRALVKSAAVVAECIYGPKSQPFTSDNPGKLAGWRLKPMAHAHQREVRAMWIPVNETPHRSACVRSFLDDDKLLLPFEIISCAALASTRIVERVI